MTRGVQRMGPGLDRAAELADRQGEGRVGERLLKERPLHHPEVPACGTEDCGSDRRRIKRIYIFNIFKYIKIF